MKDKERLEKKRRILEKLFATAMHEHTPEEEAHTAMEKATQIMAKEKIAIADFMKTTDNKEYIIDGNLKFFYGGRRTYQDWEIRLGSVIARAFDCSYINSWERSSGEIFGHETDVENVIYFFAFIQFSIAGKIRHYDKVTTKNSYGRGFVERIGQRLQEMNKKVKQVVPSDCRDLMVVKKELAERKLHDKYPNVRRFNLNKVRDHKAYQKGMKDGGKLALRRGVDGSADSRAQIRR